MDIPSLGEGVINEWLDFGNNVFTQYIPMIDLCQKFIIPFNITIEGMFDSFNSPNSTTIEYLGE
jgi:hypothetical protein